MIQRWQLQEAKNRLSQVVNEAMSSGPQIITRRGVEVAVVLSVDEYKEMVTAKGKLSDFFQDSPLAGVELQLTRDKSEARQDFDL